VRRAAGPTLRFLGAAGTVTGAKFLVTTPETRVLLDCGLFQGLKHLRLRNWAPQPFEVSSLDAVVLSHAHVDHSGGLPLLARQGFRGAIHCTAATAELLRVMLLDAAHLQEEEAAFANRHGYSKHHPALPLYTTTDAEAALGLLVAHAYGEPFVVGDDVSALFRRAGHILGSATVELCVGGGTGRRLVYSGDLGRRGRPILREPDPVVEADVLLVESTYGDRLHALHPEEILAGLVREAAAGPRTLLVPAFAVGRTQELLWTLRHLEHAGRIPELPVFVDSPMAIDVTDVYLRHPEDHDALMATELRSGEAPLRPARCRFLRTSAESRRLNEQPAPAIIISASGMATGGRVLHHLRRLLPDERTTVVLPGFQAAGTRGRALADGAREVRLFGEAVAVRARVVPLDGFSAHADRDGILGWLDGFERPPRAAWVVHGEPQPADALAAALRHRRGWNALVAEDGATVELG